MEAIERIDKQHDSFEEIDRILKFVEYSYEKYDKNYFVRSGFLSALLVNIGLISFGFFIVNEHKIIFNFSSKHLLDTNNLVVLAMNVLLSASSIWLIFSHIKVQKTRKTYLLVRKQAIEVLREAVPIVSQRENWSVIKKLEIRLRLSKLDISPEGILDDKRL